MSWIFVFILGLAVGSFLNVLIVRLPKAQSIVLPASHCPECKTPLRWFHNIPLFSYLYLKGRCTFCGTRITLVYPLVELSCAFVFTAVFVRLGVGYEALFVSFSFAMLLAMSVIDLRYKAAPDSLNLAAFAFAVAASFFANYRSVIDGFHDGLLFFGAFGLLRFALSYALDKEAMGEADILVSATIGALLGVKGALTAIFLAALLSLPASLALRRVGEVELPFVPFLALGALIELLFAPQLLRLLGTVVG